MAVKNDKCKSMKDPEPWYSLNDDDISTVADELGFKLTKIKMKKIKDLAPDYLDWFGAIESAINKDK